MKFYVKTLTASVSLAAIAVAAQMAAPTMANAQDAVRQQAAGGMEEVIVTARRRAEAIQDVPQSILALSGDSLAARGISRVADLPLLSPGLQITGTAGGGRSKPGYEIRGISISDVLGTQDQAVGSYINDIYIARNTGSNQVLYDMDNVQVLYGPQGTLFGRNTTAGAILFNSKRPVDRFEGEVWAGASSFHGYEVGGMVNTPLGEKVALRVAGQRVRNDGFTKAVITGQSLDNDNNYSGRASLLIRPSDNIKNTTIVDYLHSNTHAFNERIGAVVTTPTTIALNGVSVALSRTAITLYGSRLTAALAALPSSPYLSNDTQFEGYYIKTFGVANHTEWEISPELTVKNIFGYRDMRGQVSNDSDGTPLQMLGGAFSAVQFTRDGQHQISEELQLQGNSFDNKLTWVLGAYYFREHAYDYQFVYQLADTTAGTSNPTLTNTLATNTSKSLFAQGTYKLLPRLSFTAGARYTWDTRYVEYLNPQVRFGLPTQACSMAADLDATDGVSGNCRGTLTSKYAKPTYTFSFDYKVNDDVLLYVAHRRGYRAGGFNARATSLIAATSFAPETVKDVEIGAKATTHLSDAAELQTNLALYKMWYTNIQRSSIRINPATNALTNAIINAASADIKGLEASATLSLYHRLKLSANWAYNDAIHTRFAYAAAASGFVTDVPFGNSKNSVTLSANYTFADTPATGHVSGTVDFNYRSSWYMTGDLPVLSPLEQIPSRSVVNASLGWENVLGSRVSAEGYVKNLTNKSYITGGVASLTSFGATFVTYSDPRVFGLRIRYRFGE